MAKSKVNKVEKDEALEWAKDKFQESWDYASQRYHKSWEENWKLYNNQRVDRQHSGLVKTFVPMTHSAIVAIAAGLFSSSPKYVFTPDKDTQNGKTEILSDMMDDFYLRDGWAEKNLENGKNILITGNGVFYYEFKDGIVTKQVVPIRDAIIDPQATSWRNWRYAGRRYFEAVDNLKSARVLDPKTGELVPRYSNLDKLDSLGNGDSDFLSDKAQKDMLLGQTPSEGSAEQSADKKTKGTVEIIEVWSKARVVTVANRQVVIEDIENPYLRQARLKRKLAEDEYKVMKSLALAGLEVGPPALRDFGSEPEGLIPFALGRDEIDTSLIYGSSSVDVIKQQQELLNDWEEMCLEAELYQLSPEKCIDPKFADRIDDLEAMPGKVWPVTPGAMAWNNPPAISQVPFSERANIKQEIREALSTDGVVKGVSASTKQTATEINAQLAQASQIIQLKAQTMANDLFFQEGNIVFEIMRLYADKITSVRKVTGGEVAWEELTMDDFIGHYSPKVELDVVRESEKNKVRKAYSEMYQVLIQDPSNNLDETKRIMFPKMFPELTDQEIERIISPQATSQDSAQPMLPAGLQEGVYDE